MRIQFVAKKVEGTFEAALVVDGQFKRAIAGTELTSLFSKSVLPLVVTAQREGVTISFDINIESGEPDQTSGR